VTRNFLDTSAKSKPETTEVQGYSYNEGNVRYMLVDTPGFDDTHISDGAIIRKIREWLRLFYQTGNTLSGIVYLHSITSHRLQGSAVRYIRLFQQLVGSNDFRNIVFATTFWNEIGPSIGLRREAEILQNPLCWGQLVELGSKYARLALDRASAMSVLHLVTTVNTSPSANPVAEVEENLEDFNRVVESHVQYTAQQREEMQAWEANLDQMSARIQEQTENLERIHSENAQQRKRRTAQGTQLYQRYKCRCTLIGAARCGGCGRKVTKVSKSFYRK
jgi:hypothetical protein